MLVESNPLAILNSPSGFPGKSPQASQAPGIAHRNDTSDDALNAFL